MKWKVQAFLLFFLLAVTPQVRAAIAVVAEANHACSGFCPSSQLAINKPAGTANGNTMIAAVVKVYTGVNDGSDITPPASWTLMPALTATANGSNGFAMIAFYCKDAGGAEPANYTWTFSNANTLGAGGIVTYSGTLACASIIDTSSSNPTGNSTAPKVSQMTLSGSNSNDWAIGGYVWVGSDAFTMPGGLTQEFNITSLAGSTYGVAFGTTGPITTILAGPYTGSLASSEAWGAGGLALIPAASATPTPTATATATATNTATATPTATVTGTVTATATSTVTATATNTATATDTATPTATPTSTNTPAMVRIL